MSRILVVDDDRVMQSILRRAALKAVPHLEIDSASDDIEAIQLIQQHEYAVIVTDMAMPSTDPEAGFRVLDAAKSRSPATQVIVVTEHTLPEHSSRVRQDGGFDYISREMETFDWEAHLEWKIEDASRVHDHLREKPRRLVVTIQDDQLTRIEHQGTREYVETSSARFLIPSSELKRAMTSMSHLVKIDEVRALFATSALCRFFGRYLYDEVFRRSQEASSAYHRTLGAVDPAQQAALTLCFRSQPELLDLPFELLHDGEGYLALRHPVVRGLTEDPAGERQHGPSGLLERVLATGRSLRILLVSSNTWSSAPPLDFIPAVDVHVRDLHQMMTDLHEAGHLPDVSLEICCIPTWKATWARVRSEIATGYDVILYAGHSQFDSDDPDSSSLVFWNEECPQEEWEEICSRMDPGRPQYPQAAPMRRCGSPVAVSSRDLELALAKTHRTKLFYLASCQSGATGFSHQVFSGASLGLAHAVLRAGVPEVLGFRWPLPVSKESAKFTRRFFTSLLSNDPTGRALLNARRELKKTAGSEAIWASAVLTQRPR